MGGFRRGPLPWPEAIIFDLDGTLIDSLPDLGGALNALLAENGLAPRPFTLIRDMIGHGTRKLVERGFASHGVALDAAALDVRTDRFMQLYTPRAARETKLFPAVAETVMALAETGVPLAVCTNKPTRVSVEILLRLGLIDGLQAIVGGGFEGLPGKPDPALLIRTAELLGVAPKRALLVGDSAADVGAARAAGMPVLVLAYGYTTVPPKDLGADGVVDNFGSLMGAISALKWARAT